ncbi:MAG: SAM-dependent methyltransferase [Isosphaerales bacterium]
MKTHSLSAVSFRDPAGFVYCQQNDLRRQVNLVYREHYDRLRASGLYDELVEAGLLIKHEELQEEAFEPELAYKVIRPERIPFVSYACEWSFSQFQDAALAVLDVQRRALLRGMTLKDCSAYNLQFHAGRPIFIDTLSFEVNRPGQAWTGYRQFCEHFLAPLALMSVRDPRLGQLCRANIDGVPLDLAARLLPWRCRLRWGLAIHLFLHSALQHKHSGHSGSSSSGRLNTRSLLGLVDSLRETVRGLSWKPRKEGWASYYEDQSYTHEEFQSKARLVAEFLNRTGAKHVWDLGANTGYFSRLACELGLSTISFDADPACVEWNYLEAKRRKETRLLPLLLDLFNPTPPAGWLNRERLSIFERGKPDLVLALALIHHLAFTGNQPLDNLAEFFEGLAPWLVIEFVPESDPQAQSLQARRAGIHHPYDRERFERSFNERFTIVTSEPVSESGRTLYLMRRRNAGR